MAKGQMRSNKEVRKPKADKKAKAATGSDPDRPVGRARLPRCRRPAPWSAARGGLADGGGDRLDAL